MDPKIINRIRKLQALAADGGATEHEAQSAADMAQRLMMEHNITVATVEAAGHASEGGRRTKERQQGRAMYDFQQSLMAEVARVNFCASTVKYDMVRAGRGWARRAVGYELVGRESNVVGAQGLFDYLNATIERLAFEYVGSDNRQRMSRAATSFKRGCAERIIARLAERHAEAMAEQRRRAEEARAAAQHPGAATGNALVVSMDDYAQTEEDLNEDMRLNREPGTTARRRYLGKVRDAAQRAAEEALKEQGDLDDRAECTKIATAAVDAYLLSVSLEPDEPEVAVQRKYAITWAVDAHLQRVEERIALASETPAQKAARERRAKAEADRFWRRYYRQSEARDRATDWTALRAGSAAGDNVGLDRQVGGRGRKVEQIG